MAKRMYLVQLTRKKVLVEASSQETAVREATKSMVKSVTIPTPLETAKLMRDDTVEVIAPSLGPATPAEQSDQGGDGVGRMGLGDGDNAMGDNGS